MAAIEQDSESFSIGQLWSDKRYRAVLTQILVIAGVFIFVAWLAVNAVQNLEALGKSFGFEFLWEPASYDINHETEDRGEDAAADGDQDRVDQADHRRTDMR